MQFTLGLPTKSLDHSNTHPSPELTNIMKRWRCQHDRYFPRQLLLLDFGRASISCNPQTLNSKTTVFLFVVSVSIIGTTPSSIAAFPTPKNTSLFWEFLFACTIYIPLQNFMDDSPSMETYNIGSAWGDSIPPRWPSVRAHMPQDTIGRIFGMTKVIGRIGIHGILLGLEVELFGCTSHTMKQEYLLA